MYVDPRFRDQWRDIFVCKPKLRSVPWYLILGNHDYESHPQLQIDYTSNNTENKDRIWNLPAPYYTRRFDGLDLDLFGIDTNCVQDYVVAMKPSIKNFLVPQKKWLREVYIYLTFYVVLALCLTLTPDTALCLTLTPDTALCLTLTPDTV